MKKETIPSLFVICVIATCAISLAKPDLFIWFKPYISILLGIIMFGMGLTLETADFKSVLQLRFKIIWLVVIKYLTMPAITYAIGYVFKLPHEQLIGLVLVSACPGGTAAAVMSYLARANVVLTLVLTLLTTVLSPILIPMITYIFFHKYINIDVTKMAEKSVDADGRIVRKTAGMPVKQGFMHRRDADRAAHHGQVCIAP